MRNFTSVLFASALMVGFAGCKSPAPAPEQRHQFLPLLLRQVRACGVVTGRVQQHHITGRECLQGLAHGREVDRTLVRLVVRVAGQRELAPPSKFSNEGGFRKSVFSGILSNP